MKDLPPWYWAPILVKLRGFGDLIPSRELITLLLCSRPRLLRLGSGIHWLFLRVLQSRWHLWGIDPKGNLIIVEIGTDRDEASKDPFRGLVRYVKTRIDNEEWSTRALRDQWREHLVAKQHGKDDLAAFWLQTRAGRTYRRAVERAFAQRQASSNPSPIFIAVVASRRSEFRLSKEGLRNLSFLQELAGPAQVQLRVIYATLAARGWRIHCWSPRTQKEAAGTRGGLMH